MEFVIRILNGVQFCIYYVWSVVVYVYVCVCVISYKGSKVIYLIIKSSHYEEENI